MIDATCAACGTLNRIAEGDVPAGAKFVPCASCKSRIALPGKGPPALPTMPKKPPPIPGQSAKAIDGRESLPAVSAAEGRRGSIDLADLPVPKRSSPLAGTDPSKPAPRSALDADLPTPKPRAAPPASALDLDELLPADLPAPKSKSAGTSDLPMPKPRAAPPASALDLDELLPADLPAPKSKSAGISDLPMPKPRATPPPRPAPEISDLSAPRAKPAIADLPTPKRPVAPDAELDIIDLPMPKAHAEIIDLPMPKAHAEIIDLPMPKPGANNDLPAPKGFFDDLPQPARHQPARAADAGIDLPAPKGFFDDLPQPARASSQAKSDEVAPKGFFDDLPQPARASSQAKSDEVAPKGFFEDLPMAKPPQAKPPAPGRGLFDDLPEPQAPAPSTKAELSSSDLFLAAPGLDLEPSTSGSEQIRLEESVPNIDLAPAGGATTMDQLDELDLSAPSAPPGIRISTPAPSKAKPADGAPVTPIAPYKAAGGELKLELEGETPAAVAPKLLVPKRKAAAAEVDRSKGRRTKIVLGAVLGLAVAGAGGGYLYHRHAAAQAKADEISTDLATARTALKAGDPLHWQHAATAAKAVLELDATNSDALGIGAEALLAGALDTGINGPQRIAQGKKLLQDALDASVAGPALERAQGLGAIAANQADRAVTKLQALATRSPKDGFLALYLGWAQLAKGDADAATKSFDQAISDEPAVKVSALFGRGRSKLQLGDLDGARADFTAVLDAAKDHIGAQVGLAAALPPAQTTQREKDLLAILERKDIATADPRAVVLAWSLAADVARASGRLDVARERYRKAIAIAPNDITALTGLAAVELADGKLAFAAETIQKALVQSATDSTALIVEAEVWIRQGKVGAAADLVKQLAARTPPLPKVPLAHLGMLRGKILEIQGQDDDAANAYVEAAKLAGDLDLEPTITAVAKLGALSKKATDAKDDKKAADYHDRADQLLSALAARAQDDPQLAMTLGVAYLQSGDATKAEALLRRAVEMHGNDIEAKLGLAKALSALGRTNDALEQLTGALAIDKTRTDIALEIARTLEAANRTAEASAAYARLLAAPDVTVEARVHAGRYLARTGDIKNAAAQAAPILAAEPDNAAGHYLKAEGLLVDGKLDEARKEITFAVDADPDAQYLDAQGRIAEASLAQSEDTKYQDLALRSYQRASEVAPTMLNPLIGQGRMYVALHELAKALEPLQAGIKVDPTNTEIMYLMGVALQGLQQRDNAIKWLQASTQSRSDAEVFWRLGQLYIDANRGGEAVKALDRATRLGAEQELKVGKPISWLTDAWFFLGDTELKNFNAGGAKKAWQKFVDRKPPDGARLDDVKQHLATDLR